MENPNAEFLAFWKVIRDGVHQHHFNQILEGMSPALERILQRIDAKLLTPQYLAYRTMIDSARHAWNFDSLIGYPKVSNKPVAVGAQLIDVSALKKLMETGRHGVELLLDILEGGQPTKHRSALSIALDAQEFVSETDVVIGSHENEIRIPLLVDIDKDIEPYLEKFNKGLWNVSIELYRMRRTLVIAPLKLDDNHDEYDELMGEISVAECQFTFLNYILQCLKKHSSIGIGGFQIWECASRLEDMKSMVAHLTAKINREFHDESFWSRHARFSS
ncbi:hypothetical protein F5Y12DRAFT_714173 [Xylaria sp. FL1777]|nr:hypothetical protein F5Y12DRAFT_714173 [Xylaria sp. FL1777]